MPIIDTQQIADYLNANGRPKTVVTKAKELSEAIEDFRRRCNDGEISGVVEHASLEAYAEPLCELAAALTELIFQAGKSRGVKMVARVRLESGVFDAGPVDNGS